MYINEDIRIGTVSHGTLLPKDLAPAIIGTYEAMGGEGAAEYRALIEGLLAGTLPDLYGDVLGDLLDEVMDAISAQLLSYLYFGMLEGDSSDLGIWPSPELPDGVAEMLLIADQTDSNDVEIDALRTTVGLLLDALRDV